MQKNLVGEVEVLKEGLTPTFMRMRGHCTEKPNSVQTWTLVDCASLIF
jgi:hypothetical protein